MASLTQMERVVSCSAQRAAAAAPRHAIFVAPRVGLAKASAFAAAAMPLTGRQTRSTVLKVGGELLFFEGIATMRRCRRS
jgi:hypothetical protein